MAGHCRGFAAPAAVAVNRAGRDTQRPLACTAAPLRGPLGVCRTQTERQAEPDGFRLPACMKILMLDLCFETFQPIPA